MARMESLLADMHRVVMAYKDGFRDGADDSVSGSGGEMEARVGRSGEIESTREVGKEEVVRVEERLSAIDRQLCAMNKTMTSVGALQCLPSMIARMLCE